MRQEKRSIEEAELASIREQKRIDKVIAERMNLQNANEDFKDICEYFDIPLFTPNMGESDWDRRFLTDMIRIMSQGKIVSDRQIERIRNIIPQFINPRCYDLLIDEEMFLTNKCLLIIRL